jgi:Flp pilus assembly protein TadG
MDTQNLPASNSMKHQAGQELVEFAIILPLLLLLVFGAVDLGRLFHAYITISNAAREGARYGIIYPEDTASILTITRREAQESGLDLNPAVSAVVVSFPQGFGQQLPIRVTVTYHFQLILAGVLTSQDLTLSRSAEMMVP